MTVHAIWHNMTTTTQGKTTNFTKKNIAFTQQSKT